MTITILNKKNFDRLALAESRYVIIMFFSQSCGPCQMFDPVYRKTAEMNNGGGLFKFTKISLDNQEGMDFAEWLKIEATPALLVIKDGKVVKKSFGFMDEMTFEREILTPVRIFEGQPKPFVWG